MTLALNLLKAEHVGVRDLRQHLPDFLKGKSPLIITSYGKPAKVILNYEEILELVDILDELSDPETVAAVIEGRRVISRGAKGIPISEVFSKKKTAKSAKLKKK